MSPKVEPTTAKPEPEFVPIASWGKDHFSMLAYIECRCVDHRGVVDQRHMRADPKVHPHRVDARSQAQGHVPGTGAASQKRKKYPTKLKDGLEKHNHDDWSCLEDMEAGGLLEWNGTGMNPVFKLTTLGKIIAASLRSHKMEGGVFANFEVPPEVLEKMQPVVEVPE